MASCHGGGCDESGGKRGRRQAGWPAAGFSPPSGDGHPSAPETDPPQQTLSLHTPAVRKGGGMDQHISRCTELEYWDTSAPPPALHSPPCLSQTNRKEQ